MNGKEVSADSAYDLGYDDGLAGKQQFTSLSKQGLGAKALKAYLEGYDDGELQSRRESANDNKGGD